MAPFALLPRFRAKSPLPAGPGSWRTAPPASPRDLPRPRAQPSWPAPLREASVQREVNAVTGALPAVPKHHTQCVKPCTDHAQANAFKRERERERERERKPSQLAPALHKSQLIFPE